MPLSAFTPLRGSILAGLALAALAAAPAEASDPPASERESPTRDLPKIEVTAEALKKTVTEGTGSYTSGALTVGSKRPQSMRRTPQSVSVVTRQRIEEQKLNTLDAVLAQTPGISVQNQTLSDAGYFARGFQVQTGQVDGVPWTLGTNNYGYAAPDTALYDHVEILRGSAGLLNGAGNPGAVVNLVRKRPLASRQVQATLDVGSWNQARVVVDVSQPFTSSTRGRAVALYEDRDYFYDVAESQKAMLYGVVEHDLTPRTRVSAGGLFQQFDTLPMHAVAMPRYTDGSSLDLPRSTFLGAAWNRNDVRTVQWFADVEHEFNDDWYLKVSAFGQDASTDYKVAFLLGAIDPQTGAGSFQRGNAVDGSDDQYGVDASISGAFSAFGRRHEVLLGANWADRANYYDVIPLYLPPYSPVDIFNYDPYTVPEPVTPPSTNAHQQDTEQSGVYGTVRLQLTDALHTVVGGRWSEWRFQQRNMTTGALVSRYRDRAFMPYGGIIYDFNAMWSAYASYAEIFQVQNAFGYDGRRLDPIIGGTYETGIKGELADGRLNIAAALFHMDRENVAQRDPLHPGPTECNGLACFMSEGKQRSRGVEFEVSGRLTPRWNLFAGYTYNKTEYVRDRTVTGAPSDNEGKPIASWTPEHILRIWTQYVLPVADDRLSLGGGVSAQTKFYRILNAGTVNMTQPAYALLSARVGYKVNDTWSLALNLNNLLDRKYYARMNLVDQGSVYGEPRNVLLSVQGRF